MNNFTFSLLQQNSLSHYGTVGMKWGIRNYQYADGSLTPAGRRHYYGDSSEDDSKSKQLSKSVLNRIESKSNKEQLSYIESNTSLKRIQTNDILEDHAFYSTYLEDDNNKYLGLFGDNLKRRARRIGQDVEVYQLDIKSKKNLAMPSDENCRDIMSNLLKDEQFAADTKQSIIDSKAIMKRPQQQKLFNNALKTLHSDIEDATPNQMSDVYKAFNLTLTNHNETQIRAQEKFYSEMKKKGYDAIIDVNDKEFSSYQAKNPVIVFNLEAVELRSVVSPDPKVTSALGKKYNAERLSKDAVKQTTSVINSMLDTSVKTAEDFVYKKLNSYLNET